MARRPKRTLMDFMVIAISPALIMGMVGSLLFFLLTVFYQGQYGGRLDFVFAMFTLAIVLIARISMEEGREYASMFGIPLAIVTTLALERFIELRGALAPLSLIINIGLIALVWWSADKLTWDCTFIDDTQGASGEGLLQGLGFDTATVERQSAAGVGATGGAAYEEDRGAAETAGPQAGPEWYGRMIRRRRRPHTPGVWVIYYALATLPLFVVGDALLPADDADSRHRAFLLLCIYVGCALGLLLTTSFLGLRRYLRQRHVSMPAEVAGLWLGLGAVHVLALLLLALLLPRPGASMRISQLPFVVGSPGDLSTQRWARGDHGPLVTQETARSRPDDQVAPPPPDGQPAAEAPPPSPPPPSPAPATDQPAPGADQSPAPQASHQRPPNPGSDASDDQATQRRPAPDTRRPPPEKNGPPSPGSQTRSPSDRGPSEPPQEDAAKSPANRQADPSSAKPAPSLPRADLPRKPERVQPVPPDGNRLSHRFDRAPLIRTIPHLAGGLTNLIELAFLIKLAFLALLVAALAFAAWRYRAEIHAAWVQLIAGLQRLWVSLWGTARDDDGGAAAFVAQAAGRSSPTFTSFADPFASGQAGRHSTEQLVQYSFAALEAWARDHGCPRGHEQTPLEFARDLAAAHAGMAREIRILAELFSRMVYGREQIGARWRDDLRRLWQHLRAAS